MKTVITIKAWNRPDYFEHVIRSLERLEGISNYNIVISLDRSSEAVEQRHIQVIKLYASNPNNYHIFTSTGKRGCAGNTRLLLEHAFNDLNANRVIHLEDDTIVGKDFLEYMEWGLEQCEQDPKLFAVCPFIRAASKRWVPDTQEPKEDRSFLRSWFECGGGWGMPRRSWDLIETKGGIFGAEGNTNQENLVGQEWKDSILISDDGSWAWPINQFFRERSKDNHFCIFPVVSRTNNIGSQRGRFNPSVEWHADHIWDPEWINGPDYYHKELSNIYILDKTTPVDEDAEDRHPTQVA